MTLSFTFDEGKKHADYCILGALENIKIAIAGGNPEDIIKHLEAARFGLEVANDFMKHSEGVA